MFILQVQCNLKMKVISNYPIITPCNLYQITNYMYGASTFKDQWAPCCNTWFFRPTIPNNIVSESFIFPQYTLVTNGQANRWTEWTRKPTCNIVPLFCDFRINWVSRIFSRGLGEHRKLHEWGLGHSPGQNRIRIATSKKPVLWRISEHRAVIIGRLWHSAQKTTETTARKPSTSINIITTNCTIHELKAYQWLATNCCE